MSKKEVFGHSSNISAHEKYDYLSQDEKYWFGWQLCLLGDGTNLYSHPGDLALLHVTERTTLGDYTAFLNRLLRIDTLYTAPTFQPGYFFEGPVSDRYSQIPGEVLERLREITDVRLSIALTGVELTDSQSRKVFKTSQQHVAEDPAGYTDYNFKFDTLTLKVRAWPRAAAGSGHRVRSLSFDLELPVMFRLLQPTFMAEALQKAPLDKSYYSRYVSGARSFERLFPELAETTAYLSSVTPKDLEQYLEEQARSSGAPISLLGLQINRDLIEVWGVLLMLCVHLYFCMHYRALVSRLPRGDETLFPWIGLYRDLLSTLVFQISIALPFGVCLFAVLRDSSSHFNPLEFSWLIFALLLLGWTEVIYVRYRRSRPED
jgi:hypothetical protein